MSISSENVEHVWVRLFILLRAIKPPIYESRPHRTPGPLPPWRSGHLLRDAGMDREDFHAWEGDSPIRHRFWQL